MQLGHRGVLLLMTIALALGLAAPARAADPAPTTLTLRGAAGPAGSVTTLSVALLASGAAVPDTKVRVQRRVSGTWRALGTVTTDADGRGVLDTTLRRSAADNVYRASYAGDTTYAASGSGAVTVALVRRASRLVVGGPSRVVDEQTTTVSVRWTVGTGEGVPGTVRLQSRVRGGSWTPVKRLTTDNSGRAELRVRPRTDTFWRAVVRGNDWVKAAVSKVHTLDNRPPHAAVVLPAKAPRPRVKVPVQARAVGAGAHLVVSTVPRRVWRQMTGRTWHAGCPVGRAGLRLVRVNYWDYAGYRRRGELVAATGAAGKMGGALAEMYRRGYPLRSMYRVDRFGWSAKLQGGNDYASMAAGNTSAFNCRSVVNKPGVRSPHASGRSLDLNTWENPYRSATGVVPNRFWQPRSHPLVAWRSRQHAVVGIMARHGLNWTYGLGDTQHFDASGAHGRPMLHPQCSGFVCE